MENFVACRHGIFKKKTGASKTKLTRKFNTLFRYGNQGILNFRILLDANIGKLSTGVWITLTLRTTHDFRERNPQNSNDLKFLFIMKNLVNAVLFFFYASVLERLSGGFS